MIQRCVVIVLMAFGGLTAAAHDGHAHFIMGP
jgi:hypothetical protein